MFQLATTRVAGCVNASIDKSVTGGLLNRIVFSEFAEGEPYQSQPATYWQAGN